MKSMTVVVGASAVVQMAVAFVILHASMSVRALFLNVLVLVFDLVSSRVTEGMIVLLNFC